MCLTTADTVCNDFASACLAMSSASWRRHRRAVGHLVKWEEDMVAVAQRAPQPSQPTGDGRRSRYPRKLLYTYCARFILHERVLEFATQVTSSAVMQHAIAMPRLILNCASYRAGLPIGCKVLSKWLRPWVPTTLAQF